MFFTVIKFNILSARNLSVVTYAIMKAIQCIKDIYYTGINLFVFSEIHNKNLQLKSHMCRYVTVNDFKVTFLTNISLSNAICTK